MTAPTKRRANVSVGRRQQKHSEKTCWQNWVDHPTLKSNSGHSFDIAYTQHNRSISSGTMRLEYVLGHASHRNCSSTAGQGSRPKMLVTFMDAIFVPLNVTGPNSPFVWSEFLGDRSRQPSKNPITGFGRDAQRICAIKPLDC